MHFLLFWSESGVPDASRSSDHCIRCQYISGSSRSSMQVLVPTNISEHTKDFGLEPLKMCPDPEIQSD